MTLHPYIVMMNVNQLHCSLSYKLILLETKTLPNNTKLHKHLTQGINMHWQKTIWIASYITE